MFDSNEKSNIYSPYQTLTPSKPISNSLRSLFSSHFLPQSYIKPLNFHPNLSTKLSQSTYQKSFESKSSLLKTPKLSTSTNEIERISNQYKKLLNLRLKEEKTERIFKEFKIFKGFEKRLIVNNLIINGDNDINTSDTGICDNNIHYFLYKLDEFFHEKIEELLKSQKINEKFIKEVFSFISDQIQYFIKKLIY